MRRSVRVFTGDAVPDESIDRLLKAAMAAPSACNKQPWVFYVVKNREVQLRLRDASRYTHYDSPLIMVVCANTKRSLGNRREDFWVQDCSASIENILLEAVSLGLGTCWCGLYPMLTPQRKVSDILQLPEHLIPIALIHIGYPAAPVVPRTQYHEKFVVIVK